MMIIQIIFLTVFATVYLASSRAASGKVYGLQEDALADVWMWDDGMIMIWDDDIEISVYG